MEEERLISQEFKSCDLDESSLRPRTFSEYIGQSKVKENLIIFIEATKQRGEALDHVFVIWSADLEKQHLPV